MTTGQRMKERRKAIGLSAEQVAEILGVSPATIYRYENGDIEKVPGDRLGAIAKALQTTPAYLMGWDNNSAPTAFGERSVGNDILDDIDIAFYGEFKELDEDQKDTVRDMVRVMRERRAKKQEK